MPGSYAVIFIWPLNHEDRDLNKSQSYIMVMS